MSAIAQAVNELGEFQCASDRSIKGADFIFRTALSKPEYIEIVKFFITGGEVDLDQVDGNDKTPLTIAMLNNNRAAYDLLLENNADIEAFGEDGWSRNCCWKL